MKTLTTAPPSHRIVGIGWAKRPAGRPVPGRRAVVRLAGAGVCVVALTACGPHRPPAAAVPKAASTASVRAAVPSGTADPGATPGQLTDAQLAWLDAASALQLKANHAPGDPNGDNMTTAQLRATANALRGCTRALNRIGAPDERLQPVYRIVRQECGQYDKVATCFETIAAAPATLDVHAQRQLRKLHEAGDCVTAGMLNAGNLLVDAETKIAEIKTESFDKLDSCAPGTATPSGSTGEGGCTGK